MSIIFLQNIDRVKWIQETIKNLSPRRKKRKKGSRQTHGLHKHISSSVQAKYDDPGRAASNFVGGHHETPLPVQETPGTEVNCHLELTDVPFCPTSNLTSLSLIGQMEVVETNVKGEKKNPKPPLRPQLHGLRPWKNFIVPIATFPANALHSLRGRGSDFYLRYLRKNVWIVKPFEYNIAVELWEARAELFIYTTYPQLDLHHLSL